MWILSLWHLRAQKGSQKWGVHGLTVGDSQAGPPRLFLPSFHAVPLLQTYEFAQGKMWLVFNLAHQKQGSFKMKKKWRFHLCTEQRLSLMCFLILEPKADLAETWNSENGGNIQIWVVRHSKSASLGHQEPAVLQRYEKAWKAAAIFTPISTFLLWLQDYKTLLPSAGAGAWICASYVLSRHCSTDGHP